MLTKKGINGTAINNCPICNGTGEPSEANKKVGMLKCSCILHAHICGHLENLHESKESRKELIRLMELNHKICDCDKYMEGK